MKFKNYLEIKKSPFFNSKQKHFSKKELDSLPIWDQEGGIGCRESKDTKLPINV